MTEPHPPATSLTESERRLVEAVAAGQLCRLEADEQVRGSVIAALVTASHPEWSITPVGLMLLGCEIVGGVWLHTSKLVCPLSLTDCTIQRGPYDIAVNLQSATAGRIGLRLCKIKGDLRCPRMHADSFNLYQSTIEGRVDLSRAEIDREFEATGLKVESTEYGTATRPAYKGPAIDASNLRAGDFRMPEAQVKTELSLTRAVIRGQLNLSDTKLNKSCDLDSATIGSVLAHDIEVAGVFSWANTRVAGDVELKGARLEWIPAWKARVGSWNMDEATVKGTLQIDGHIDGEFSARSAHFEAAEDVKAISASRLTAESIVLTGAQVGGGIALTRATVSEGVMLDEATFSNPGEIAIQADSLKARFVVLLGSKVEGSINADDCEVTDVFNARDLVVENASGYALSLQTAHVGGLRLENTRLDGKLRIPGIEIDWHLSADELHVSGDNDIAMHATAMQARRVLLQRAQITGEVMLDGARVSEFVTMSNSVFSNANNPTRAINAEQLKTGSMWMVETKIQGGLYLRNAVISETFHGQGLRIECAAGHAINAGETRFGMFDLAKAELLGTLWAPGAQVNGYIIGDDIKITGCNQVGVLIDDADALYVRFVGAQISEGFSGRRMRVLRDFSLEGINTGFLTLNETEVGGHLNLGGAQLKCLEPFALQTESASFGSADLSGASVTGNVSMHSVRVAGLLNFSLSKIETNADGCVGFYGAHLGGLMFGAAQLTGRLSLHNAVVDGDVDFTHSELTNELHEGVLSAQRLEAHDFTLDGAQLRGQLDLTKAKLSGGFFAGSLNCTTEVICAIAAADVTALEWQHRGGAIEGGVNLVRAQISKGLFCSNTRFSNESGPFALQADEAELGFVTLSECRFDGPVLFRHSRTNFYFAAMGDAASQSHFTVPGGGIAALDLAYSNFSGGLRLEATHVEGGINAHGVSIGGLVRFDALQVTSHGGMALDFSNADLGGPLQFHDKCDLQGGLSLDSVTSGDVCDLRRLKVGAACFVESDADQGGAVSKKALSAIDAQIDRLILPAECPQGIVNLSRATLGALEDFASGWPPPLPVRDHVCKDRVCHHDEDAQHLVLKGLRYEHLENPSGQERDDGDGQTLWQQRIRWLNGQSAEDLVTSFSPQPWQQLARVFNEHGYEADARHISIQQRIRYRCSSVPGWSERTINRILHWFSDYGYSPRKTVAWSLAFIVMFGMLFQVGAGLCTRAHCMDGSAYLPVRAADLAWNDRVAGDADSLSKIYPRFSAMHYSADLFIPLLDLQMVDYWRVNTRLRATIDVGETTISLPIGKLLYIAALAEIILGALLVALAITGFTGLLTNRA